MKTSRKARISLPLAMWIVMLWTAVQGQEPGATAPLPVAEQSSQQALIEQGRATVPQVCIACHNGIMRMLEVTEKSREEWRDTVHSMIGRGAHVFPDEIEPLTEYLVANAGRGRAEASAAPPTDAGQSAATTILAERCQFCHDIETATAKLDASESWAAVIDRMVTFGATVTPAERQALIEHLDGLE